MCRNSFRNLKKPDISAVELLKDVQNKNELLVRLVTFDTEHKEDDDHELQQERETNMCVIKVESSSFSEIDPLSASGEDTNASSVSATSLPGARASTETSQGIILSSSTYCQDLGNSVPEVITKDNQENLTLILSDSTLNILIAF